MRCFRWPLLLLALAAGAPADDAAGIEELVTSSIPATREQGAAALGKQGDTRAAKQLIGMLDDADWGVRLAAIKALGPIRFGPGRDALVDKALNGEIRAVRTLAATMLRDHDKKQSGARLARRVFKLRKESRPAAIEALGFIGGDEAVGALSRLVKSSEVEHATGAARSLGRLHAGEKALTGALKHKEDMVRLLAAAALAGIDSKTARESVLTYVEKQSDLSESWLLSRVGRNGAQANRDAFAKILDARIAKSKKPGSLLRAAEFANLYVASSRKHFKHRDALTRAFAFHVAGLGAEPVTLAEAEPALKHKDRRLQQAAARAVLDLEGGGEPLEAALAALLMHAQPDVAMVAVRKAVETRTKKVLPELTAIAEGKSPAKKDWQVRVAATVGIGRVGYDRDFSVLKRLAGSRDWWLRGAAMEGLYHTYDKSALPILISAFNDKNPVVRMTARRNLRLMTSQHYLKRDMYEKWWERVKGTLELKHPEKKLAELDKYGYSTKKFLQEVLRGTDIVAVKGRWDKVEKILADLEVKHNAWRAQEIKTYGLSPKQVVLVNCEGSVDSGTTKILQWMVVAGGYMATTDWSLVNATTKTFPSVVKGYVKQSTGNDVVVVSPAAPGHNTLKGVFHDGVELKWWLEIQAFPIAIEDPVRSTVLVDSLEMLVRYGSSAMMVEFPAGLGKVMHSTSHFYLQKEGFAHASDAQKRKIFAADHLGLSMEEIRALDSKGAFGNMNDTTSISKSYSMFHLLVNFIGEKQQKDLER